MNCRICKRHIPDNSLYCNWCCTYQLAKKTKEVTVPTPKQLPSGNWRVYLERELQSVTAETPEACKAQAIAIRKQWETDEAAGLHIPPPQVVSLYSVISDYIASREPVRSPSTIDGYNNILRNRFKDYMDLDVHTIDFQKMVNDEVLKGVSAKTVRNAWGLVCSALRWNKTEFEVPTLPRIIQAERNWLTYDQILLFLSAIRGSKYELPALLALHSLRKSELLGLRISDYDAVNNIIRVRGALLKVDNGYVRTELNKTDSSSRDVPIIIPRLTELLNNIINNNNNLSSSQSSHLDCDKFIVEVPRDGIYKAINQACLSVGLPPIGIHGLRHSFASIAYHLGWKKMTTMQIGGWHNSKVLDAIYTHNADFDSDISTMVDFFVQNNVQNTDNSC